MDSHPRNTLFSRARMAPRSWSVFLVLAVAISAFAGLASAASADSIPASAAAKIADSAGTFYSIDGEAAAAKKCAVKKQLSNGKVVTVYKTKIVKVKVKGKTVRKRVYVTKLVNKTVKVNGKSVKRKVRVRVPKTAACSKTKLCTVKKKNSKGKNVTVYLTRVVKTKVRKGGKLVTVKKRVFVYKKVKGKKVKLPKLGPCKSTSTTTKPGIPVAVTISDGSVAHLDFGGFQRDLPLSGALKGFIVGKGFVLGQENLITLTSGRIFLAPTGIFIDDVCNGQVSDSIRTDQSTFTEIDPASTGNNVTVKKDATVSGLLHMRVQAALDMRNDDTGCNDPYFTTGWTDFTVPLFVKGKLSAGKGGLTTTLTVGETVLDDLSACLATGAPTLPCNGFAIPFPALLTAEIISTVKIG
ncbi:MAG: hypothetical protein ACJ77Z_00195 [Thermoleophilaceae bacterium]